MQFEITIERYGWLWSWQVSDGSSRYSDVTFTKRGAIWAANRQAKWWAKGQKEIWTVNL